MRRKITKRLEEWKRNDAPETALLIDGARRVGKSYAVAEFARAAYRSSIIIDFNKTSKTVRDFFENDLENLDVFFRKLSEFYGVRLYPGESLIVFDEVQEFPRARAAIKYLVEDGRYHFIETGSLVSIRENVEGIVVPSEEDHVKMHPMDFEEFLWATGREMLAKVIAEHALDLTSLGATHRKAMDALREYLVVGGMPQAVEKWIASNDLMQVNKVKHRILDLYRADIRKHAGRYALKAEGIFDEIPSQLMRHDKKFRLSSISSSARLREYEDAFLWLQDAMTVNVAYNTTEPTVGLKLSADNSTMKCYLADTGLLVTDAFSSGDVPLSEIHRRLMFDSLSLNKGMLTENLVAQMLAARNRELFFYARNDRESAKDRMEIDFLLSKDTISRSKNVVAIEVKSEKDYSTDSLTKFSTKFRTTIGSAYIFHPKDVSTNEGVVSLPLYMLPWVRF